MLQDRYPGANIGKWLWVHLNGKDLFPAFGPRHHTRDRRRHVFNARDSQGTRTHQRPP